MGPTSVHNRAADARDASRSSIYLAAALYCDGSASSVKIRNISSSGALIEGSSIPVVGSLVQLVRGGLIVHALVAWSAGGKCGLKFSGSVDVQSWRAAPSNGEQQRVDEIIRLVKAGTVPLPVPPLTPQNSEPNDPGAELPKDLRRAIDLLDALGEMLALDPMVVAKHPTALQNLDIATQVIAAAEAILSGSADAEADSPKLQGLRRSADQALRHRLEDDSHRAVSPSLK